jgi:hypothetical protein
MKKIGKILLFIMIISICLVSGYFAYKHFYKDTIKDNNEEIIIISDEDEITLGDAGKCSKITGGPPGCAGCSCSGTTASSCSCNASGVNCCMWKASSTPKPTATPKPTVTPVPTAKAQSCSSTPCCVGGKNVYTSSVCNDANIPKICGSCPVDNRKCCTSCGRDKNCQNNCKDCGCPAGKKQIEKNGVLTCTSCPAGYFSLEGMKTCSYCNGIVSSDGGDCNLCKGANTYVENGKCETCSFPHKLEKDSSGKVICKQCTITITENKVVSPDSAESTGLGSWTLENCEPDEKNSVNISVSGGHLASSDTSSQTSGRVSASGLKDCDSVSYTVSFAGISKTSKTIKVTTVWKDMKNQIFNERPPYTESKADEVGSSTMAKVGDCTKKTGDDGDYYFCKDYKERGCATSRPQPLYSYCCADNGLPSLSENVFDVNGVSVKDCSFYAKKKNMPDVEYTLLENYDVSKCKAPGKIVGMCTTSSTKPATQEKQTSECEDKVRMDISDGVKCSNTTSSDTNGFYKIDCKKTVYTSFDYGNDKDTNTVRTLARGEGIAFGINVETSIKCRYEFYEKNWKNVYNSALNRIRNVDTKLVDYINDYVKTGNSKNWDNYINNTILKIKGVKTVKLLYEWANIVLELRDIVNYYNSYEPETEKYGENGTITLTTKENGKKVTKNYNLISETVSKGTIKKTERVEKKLGVAGITNPYNYVASSESNPSKVTLIPERVCVNISTGDVTSMPSSGSCPKNSIDGGNKMYINYDTDISIDNQTYPMSIKVSGLASNDSKVNNDKCTFRVVNIPLTYRPIDVSNPFINDSWEKGVNWVNKLYDFTRVIHADTWRESAYNTIKLSPSDIVDIQVSNSKNKALSPYLGLCDKIDTASQDVITKKLCAAINK